MTGFAIDGSTPLVTGANGGLGEAFVEHLLRRGARKVYASARRPRLWEDERVVPLVLDVSDPHSIRAASEQAPDVTVLINNAAVPGPQSLLGDPGDLRRIFETNYFGPIELIRRFAPLIETNGGGAVQNVLSILSWLGTGNGYSSSKAALWSATNALRLELDQRGIAVSALHLGYTATPMTASLAIPMNTVDSVVPLALDGIENGDHEVLADDHTRAIKLKLAEPVLSMYPQLAGQRSLDPAQW